MKTVIFLFLLISSTSSYATILTYDAIDKGSYWRIGWHPDSNATYTRYTQGLTASPQYAYFVFDLSNLVGPISSAILRLDVADGLFIPIVSGPVPSDTTIGISDYTLDISDLKQTYDFFSSEGQVIWENLGAGSIYATSKVYFTDIGSWVDFILSDQAIEDINNAAGSEFALAAITTPETQSHESVIWERHGEPGTHQLILNQTTQVPEPASILLLGSALAGLTFARRKNLNKK